MCGLVLLVFSSFFLPFLCAYFKVRCWDPDLSCWTTEGVDEAEWQSAKRVVRLHTTRSVARPIRPSGRGAVEYKIGTYDGEGHSTRPAVPRPPRTFVPANC